jgi:Na+-driven multidrug efflux pump
MRCSSAISRAPQALAAVTLMFPLYMLIVALATLVSSGMSSILARHLGAWRVQEARARLRRRAWSGRGHGLSSDRAVPRLRTAGRPAGRGRVRDLAAMGLVYLRITVFAAPLIFVLSVNSDALRNEGLVLLMAAMSLLVSLTNMAFNYVLIGLLDMGVAGSAYGTAMAQALALAIILVLPRFRRHRLRPSALWRIRRSRAGAASSRSAPRKASTSSASRWGRGRSSLALQWVEAPDYDATVSAYGIVTRLITFAFLPLLGLAHAMQTITGNNFGAGKFHRTDREPCGPRSSRPSAIASRSRSA